MRCDACRYYASVIPETADGFEPEDAFGFCEYPRSLLPLSMAGYANRERESVKPSDLNCPTHTAKIETKETTDVEVNVQSA